MMRGPRTGVIIVLLWSFYLLATNNQRMVASDAHKIVQEGRVSGVVVAAGALPALGPGDEAGCGVVALHDGRRRRAMAGRAGRFAFGVPPPFAGRVAGASAVGSPSGRRVCEPALERGRRPPLRRSGTVAPGPWGAARGARCGEAGSGWPLSLSRTWSGNRRRYRCFFMMSSFLREGVSGRLGVGRRGGRREGSPSGTHPVFWRWWRLGR